MLEHGMTKEEFRKRFNMTKKSVEEMWEMWERLTGSATPSAAEVVKQDSLINEGGGAGHQRCISSTALGSRTTAAGHTTSGSSQLC